MNKVTFKIGEYILSDLGNGIRAIGQILAVTENNLYTVKWDAGYTEHDVHSRELSSL